jgi:predicted N-acetyltransferase YhbS
VMLGTLVVDLDYQRRGIGSKLMEWGVQEADR